MGHCVAAHFAASAKNRRCSRAPDVEIGALNANRSIKRGDCGVPEIARLLWSHFGEVFPEPQFVSIANQSVTDWRVYLSDEDDRSTDATRDILEEYRRRWGDKRL